MSLQENSRRVPRSNGAVSTTGKLAGLYYRPINGKLSFREYRTDGSPPSAGSQTAKIGAASVRGLPWMGEKVRAAIYSFG